jgi:hypothetical protein
MCGEAPLAARQKKKCGVRRAQRFQTFQFLSREDQCRKLGVSSHVPATWQTISFL